MLDNDTKNKLIAEARRARNAAYARYSNFKVGAAVLTEQGNIFSGCNIENASFGATMCAERVAIFSAVAAGETRIKAVAVIADLDKPIAPCGLCRQVIAEFGPDAEVIMLNTGGEEATVTLPVLLPLSFQFPD